MTYIGLDLGTSGLKALLIDDAENVCAEATVHLAVSRPFDGWSEQNPADWVTAAETALDRLAVQHSLANVQAIGLSGQMHGAVLLDESGRVLHPAILWNDTRATREASELDQNSTWRAQSGNIVFPGFTAPKLMWLQHHKPELFAKVAKVLLPKDYLRFWLTGHYVSDMSDASGTSWLSPAMRDWSDDLLSQMGMSRDQMPDLVEGSASTGPIRAALSSRWGIPKGCIVAGGAGDNAASAVGMGVIHPGQGLLSLGTSGVLFAPTAQHQPMPETAIHAFCHAFPETWHQMAVILSAADTLNWYARLVGQSAADLTRQLDTLQRPGKALFLPYLGGERTPLNHAGIRGSFAGLGHADDTQTLTRAVLDGITFALRDCRDAMAQTGTLFTQLIAVGGGAKSDVWLSGIATALDCEIALPRNGALGGAFGAARLSRLAVHPDTEVAAPDIIRVIPPIRELQSAYDDGFARFKSLQSAMIEFE